MACGPLQEQLFCTQKHRPDNIETPLVVLKAVKSARWHVRLKDEGQCVDRGQIWRPKLFSSLRVKRLRCCNEAILIIPLKLAETVHWYLSLYTVASTESASFSSADISWTARCPLQFLAPSPIAGKVLGNGVSWAAQEVQLRMPKGIAQLPWG